MGIKDTAKGTFKEAFNSIKPPKATAVPFERVIEEGHEPGATIALHTRMETEKTPKPKYTYRDGTVFINGMARQMIPLRNVAHMSGSGSSIIFKMPGKFVPVTIKGLKRRKLVEEFLATEISRLRS